MMANHSRTGLPYVASMLRIWVRSASSTVAIGSFFVRDWSRGIPRFLWDVTEPILAPVRRLLPPFGGLDFSPLIVIIVLQVINGYLGRGGFG